MEDSTASHLWLRNKTKQHAQHRKESEAKQPFYQQ